MGEDTAAISGRIAVRLMPVAKGVKLNNSGRKSEWRPAERLLVLN